MTCAARCLSPDFQSFSSILNSEALSTAWHQSTETSMVEFPPLHIQCCLSFLHHLWSPLLWISYLLSNLLLSFCIRFFLV